MTEREIALKLLDDYESSDKYANLALSAHVTRTLDKAQMSRVTSLFYTTVEHKLTYDYLIGAISLRDGGKIDPHTRNILRLGMGQILHISSIPDFAAVSETVKLGRHKGERAFINGVLRKASVLKEKGELPFPNREKNVARYLSVLYSFPLWTVKHFISLLGEDECEKLLKCYTEERYVDLAVNTQKISRGEYLDILRDNGIEAAPSSRSPISVRINKSIDPRLLPGFDEGLFFVQDEACTLSVLALNPKSGEKIADVCSAPGGKSFTAAILSDNGAQIYSYDLHESKLSLIREGAERLSLSSIRVNRRDANSPDDALLGSLDKVICDVPCSGLGVIGKKSDLKYRSQESLDELPELQYSILSASARYLKAGGEMIYSTCTINPRENEEVVKRFLDENEKFSLLDFELSDIRSEGGIFTFIPHRHGTDGFFIAKLKKDR